MTQKEQQMTENTPAQGVKLDGLVKQLVWQDFEGEGAKASAFYQASYMITFWRGRDEFEVSMSYPGYQAAYDGPRFHKTLEAAKAAAQADFAARILSALDLDAIAALVGDLALYRDAVLQYAGEGMLSDCAYDWLNDDAGKVAGAALDAKP